MSKSKRIAIVVSHPIQHFCPQYASWAKRKGVVMKVFFASNLGAQTYFDKDFKTNINWSSLYLDEFDHEFLNGDKILAADKNLGAGNVGDRLHAFSPDLIIYYGYFQQLSAQVRKWAIQNSVKLAYISDAEFRQHRPLWKRIVKYPFLYFYFKKIDAFLTVGDANEDYYHFYGVPKHKMKRMHFPIDINTYKNAWQQRFTLRNNFRMAHNIGEDVFVLSVAGKLVQWKCQDHLIDLLKKLEQEDRHKKYCLLIAGSGPQEELWKKKAAALKHNTTIFLGFVKPEELPAIYAASDAYVHPALREPHSLSISEAIYMGCPTIVANTCGSWGNNDDVQENKNGYVFKQGNVEDLKIKLCSFNEENIRLMGAYSHSIAVNFQLLAHGNVLENL